MPGEGRSTLISVVTVVRPLRVVWWVATHYGWIKDLFLPTPERNPHELQRRVARRHPGRQAVVRALLVGASTGSSPHSLLACVTAVPIGIAMGVSRIARGIFDPPIEFYRPLPPLAYLPLIVIWFGIDETAKIVLIYLACAAPLAMAARAGVRSVTIEQINAASRWAPRSGR